ncbi:secreted frizzled-related protein 5 [Chiloscyllium punctatum]
MSKLRAAFIGLLLAGFLELGSGGSAEEYEYYGWQSDHLQGGRFYAKQPQCVDIPSDLRLCHNIGYRKMRVPNLLEHDTLPEIKQQASSWVPLLAKRCHPDTQIFLCSLFAPICLDRPIYPCHSLCQAVRDGCSPVMESFGFPWPEMLKCDHFPLDNDLCVSLQSPGNQATQPPVSKICPPCDNEMKADVILEHFCASEFALKMKIKEIKREKGDRKIISQRKKKVLKMGPLKKKDLKKLVLFIKNGATCPCNQLENPNSNFLIMGRKWDNQFLLTVIHKWDKKNKDLRYAVKIMKTYQCPTYHHVFQ